jgi:PAS domain S-box-containing protein
MATKRVEPLPHLRQRALRRLSKSVIDQLSSSPAETAKVIHELEVHRVELEIQNEALREAQRFAENALKRYTEMFELAPLGYVVLDLDGRMREANVEARRLIGLGAAYHVVGVSFGSLLDPAQQDDFRGFLGRLFSDPDQTRPHETLAVTLLRPAATPIEVGLHASVISTRELLALVAMHDADFGRMKRAGAPRTTQS